MLCQLWYFWYSLYQNRTSIFVVRGSWSTNLQCAFLRRSLHGCPQLSYRCKMRFRLKAGTGVPRGEDRPWKKESLKRWRNSACRTSLFLFLFRSIFCGRIRLPITRLYPKIDRGHCDSGGIWTRISDAAPSCKVSRGDARQEIRI